MKSTTSMALTIILSFFVIIPTAPAAPADDNDEIERLRREAGTEIEQAGNESAGELLKLQTDTVFSSGNRALQAINPEMSVVVDAGARAAVPSVMALTWISGTGSNRP